MKNFKSISKKRKRKLKFIIYMIVILSILMFCITFKNKLTFSKKTVKSIISSCLGLNFEKNNSKTVYKEVQDNDPLIYIYSTHSYEEYVSSNNPYNIPYTVMFADFLLQTELEKYNIFSLREENYTKNYEQSRANIEKVSKNNPSIQYFIDVHRDAGTHDLTTYNDGNKSYAKFLFVIGTGYESYLENKKLASKLNDIVQSQVNGISRGLFERDGAVYNADFNENCLLIEIGSEANYMEEVTNSIEILAKAISILIGDENA